MCFSIEADLIAGVVLLPVGVAALREVRHVREVPFAALPLLFSLHQFVEVFVWLGNDGAVSAAVQSGATLAYVLFALPVLPALIPLAVLLLEPRGARMRVAPFVLLGLVVSTYLAYAVIDGPIDVDVRAHAIVYGVNLTHGVAWAILYVVAVVGPSVLSGYPSIVAFGVLNMVGLSAVAILYVSAFASLWCILAACSSLLVLVHMRRRRRLPDAHRLHGHALTPSEATV